MPASPLMLHWTAHSQYMDPASPGDQESEEERDVEKPNV